MDISINVTSDVLMERLRQQALEILELQIARDALIRRVAELEARDAGPEVVDEPPVPAP